MTGLPGGTSCFENKMGKRGNKTEQPEGCQILRDADLGLDFCEAYFTSHRFSAHSHAYYVIGFIAKGNHRFTHRGTGYALPAGGMVLFEPEHEHTCERGNEQGFVWRAVYPTREQIYEAAASLCGLSTPPSFPSVRIDDVLLLRDINVLHWAMRRKTPLSLREGLLIRFFTHLILRHAKLDPVVETHGRQQTVRKAKAYLEENLSTNITLEQLARYVGTDRYRLTRDFNSVLGLAPHRYLDCLRVRQAQQLLAKGMPPAEVASAAGFTDQSHLTKRFKRQLGVTPGRYLR